MNAEKAKDRGPFLVVTGLYLAVVAVGFHAEAPPLAPNSLFITATTVVVFAHLLNLYQIGLLVDKYPAWPFVFDLLSLGILAWIFKVLVRPIESGLGGFPFPYWSRNEDFRDFVTQSFQGRGLVLYRDSLHRFFVLALVLWGLFILWNVTAVYTLKPQNIVLRRWKLFATGWGLYLAVAVIGIYVTAEAVAWDQMIFWDTILGAAAAVLAAVFVFLAVVLDATYQKGPPMKVYIFVNVAPGRGAEVVRQLRRTEGIKSADLCAGLPDIIAVAETADQNALQKLMIDGVQQIGDVSKADTHVVSET